MSARASFNASEAPQTFGDVHEIALSAASVWLCYGVIETLLETVAPALIQRTVAVNLPFAVLCVSVYTICGYAIAFGIVALVQSQATILRFDRREDRRNAWLSIWALLVAATFLVNGFIHGQFVAVAIGVAAATAGAVWRLTRLRPGRLPSAWITNVTHPVALLCIMTGIPFIMQPRARISLGLELFVAAGWTASVAAVALGWTGIQGWPRVRRVSSSLALSQNRAPLLGLLAVVSFGVSALAIEHPPNVPRPPVARRESGGPNIVLISLDTVRADHLSLYGYPLATSEALRRFASGATVFTNAISSSNHTLPVHASIFTGVNATRHGVFATDHRITALPKEAKTLAERLHDQGYSTFASVANTGNLRPALGFAQGFSYYDNVALAPMLGPSKPYLIKRSVRDLLAHALGLAGEGTPVYRAASEINDDAERVLARTESRPFFLFLNYMDAHWPYLPPTPFRDRYPGRLPVYDWSKGPTFPLSDRERTHLISQYDGAITYLDDQLGKLFEYLRGHGLWDGALVIVTGDHGEGFGEHGVVGHGHALYQNEVRVPLIIKYPGQTHGETVDAPVSSVDLMPTVLAVVGLPVPEKLDGQSLRSVGSLQGRTVLSESIQESENDGSLTVMAAAFDGSLKGVFSPTSTELYDVIHDPQETRNLYPSRALPAEWALRLHDLSHRVVTGALMPVDGEVLDRLRSLGYIR